MKKLLFPLFMLAMIVTSCEKDPDMNKLDSDYSEIAFWFRTTA